MLGDLVFLREFRDSDLERMHSWVNNNTITKYLDFTIFPRTMNDSKKFLEMQLNRINNSYINFVISAKNDEEHKYIGSTGLKNINLIHRKAELNIVIGYNDFLGKGYGQDAIKLILKYGFDTLGLNKIYLKYVDCNISAGKSYEKSGFRYVCTMKEDFFYNGKFYDQIYMEILEKEYSEYYK